MEVEGTGSGMCQSWGDLTRQIAEEIRRHLLDPTLEPRACGWEKPGPFGMQMLLSILVHMCSFGIVPAYKMF